MFCVCLFVCWFSVGFISRLGRRWSRFLVQLIGLPKQSEFWWLTCIVFSRHDSIHRWNKYCLASQDYRKIAPEFLIEKSETAYNDYVSVHIKVLYITSPLCMLATHTALLKVHGLDAVKAKTWTRRLKEYFELMNPMIDADTGLVKGKFPFYFTRRDHRGDIQIGRLISLFSAFPLPDVDVLLLLFINFFRGVRNLITSVFYVLCECRSSVWCRWKAHI